MIKKLYITFVLLVSVLYVSAQDTLLELGLNNKLKAYYDENSHLIHKNNTNNKAPLTLPFFDDFAQNYFYPKEELWQDINVHVNSNFADNPITYGVATFDGLDYTGYPYNFSNPTAWGAADTLTSRTINLNTVTDSVFLSFFYQPQGLGNAPETKDSLRLEFFRKSDSTWVRKWGVKGSSNQPFQRVMIPVDTSFHNDEFQFRFMNWATLSGNVDHWNLDYVYLDENRSFDDTIMFDVSFITNHHNMLKEFTAMPWTHYITDSLNFMAEKMDVVYKNNDISNHAVYYEYQVLDDNGNGPVIENYPSSTSNFNVPAQTNFINSAMYVYDLTNMPAENDFYFPPDGSQNKVFQIKNYFDLNSIVDDHPENDTVISYQVFGSYYAYDDGSAEIGYGVQGIGSKLAHKFNIKKSDTLTALQIYFSPIMNNHSAESFRLKVWSSLNPEVEIYSQLASSYTSPIYSGINDFLNYNLDTPLYLNAGTYYFGWEKITDPFLNVGWDLNTNNSSKVYFNSVGVWQTASFSGSLMLRPVFGSTPDPQVSVEEIISDNNFDIYPNPAKSEISIIINDNNSYNIELIDLNGRTLLQSISTLSNKLNVNDIANGLYLIKLTNTATQATTFNKVIISK